MEEKKNLGDGFIDTESVKLTVVEKDPIDISVEAKKNEEELEKIAPVNDNEVLKTQTASKKSLIALLCIMVNILAISISALIEYLGGEHPIHISKVWGTFTEHWWWAFVAIAFILVCILAETTKRFLLLRTTLKKNMPIISLNAFLICKYYDNITPLGAGGQPFEIYYLRKKGLPVGIASGVPLTSYAISKIAYVVVSTTAILCFGFGDISPFMRVLCIIGLIANLGMPTTIVMFALLPKFSASVARGIAKLAKFLHIVKDQEALYKKLTGHFIEYAGCIDYFLKKSKKTILSSFVCSSIYYLALYSLPYAVIRLCGNHDISWGTMFAYCVICYASVTLIPTPGSSGGAELSFRAIFAKYLSGGILFWGVLSWRIFSYYIFIALGLILIVYQNIASFTKKIVEGDKVEKEKPIEPEDELEPYTPIPSTIATAEDDIDTAEPLSIAEATLEPEIEEISAEEIEIVYDNIEPVAEFTAVIESKSTVTITEERIEPVTPSNEPHQISMTELAEFESIEISSANDEETTCDEVQQELNNTDEPSQDLLAENADNTVDTTSGTTEEIAEDIAEETTEEVANGVCEESSSEKANEAIEEATEEVIAKSLTTEEVGNQTAEEETLSKPETDGEDND